jgi:hypothetical protein
MFIVNFILGLIIVIVGVIMLKMNFQVTNLFGRNNVFERRLGSGSTYFVLKVVALLVIFFGFLMMFSLHDNLLNLLLTPLTNALGI